MRELGYAKSASVLVGILILNCCCISGTYSEEVDTSFRFDAVEPFERWFKQFSHDIKQLEGALAVSAKDLRESKSIAQDEFDWSFRQVETGDWLKSVDELEGMPLPPIEKWNGIDGPRIDPIPSDQSPVFDTTNVRSIDF